MGGHASNGNWSVWVWGMNVNWGNRDPSGSLLCSRSSKLGQEGRQGGHVVRGNAGVMWEISGCCRLRELRQRIWQLKDKSERVHSTLPNFTSLECDCPIGEWLPITGSWAAVQAWFTGRHWFHERRCLNYCTSPIARFPCWQWTRGQTIQSGATTYKLKISGVQNRLPSKSIQVQNQILKPLTSKNHSFPDSSWCPDTEF